MTFGGRPCSLGFLFKPRQPQLIIGSDVVLRYLGPSDARDFCAHLHELHYEDFRDRFNGLVSDPWLDKYIARSLNEAIVIGAYVGDHLVAVAELHTGGQIPEHVAESAFSVASDWRRKGARHHPAQGAVCAPRRKTKSPPSLSKQGHRTMR